MRAAMVRLSAVPKRDAILVAAFVAGSIVAIAVVVSWGRRDSTDPARCGALVATRNRCCAAGHCMGLSTHNQEQFCAASPRRNIRRAIDSRPSMGDATAGRESIMR